MAVSTISKRTQVIDRILAELMSLRGVTSAAIVDQDGFVTHIRQDFEINGDALGAAVQIMFGSATRSAAQVGQGSAQTVISENKEGLVLLAPLCSGFVLALVADTSAMIGLVRFEMKACVDSLAKVLGGGR